MENLPIQKQEFEVIDFFEDKFVLATNKDGVLFNLGMLEERPKGDHCYVFKKGTISIGDVVYVKPVGEAEQVFLQGRIQYKQKIYTKK